MNCFLRNSWLTQSFTQSIFTWVNNRNVTTRCEICLKLTIMTSERRQWRRAVVSNVNFEHISHFLVFLLLTLNTWLPAGQVLLPVGNIVRSSNHRKLATCHEQDLILSRTCPVNIYLKNTWKRYEICLKLTIKTPERRQWRCSGVFVVNFENISYLFLALL